MDKSSNRQKEVFLQALDLPSGDAQAAFLAEACAVDDAMRQRVEAMLKAHGQPDSFLERPAAMLDPTVDRSSEPATAVSVSGDTRGTRVGPYKLREQIGEGGMGVVYMAQQEEPIRRTVALKIIKPGMDSGQVLARFEAERQALALMDHPNIARVLDAGATADGRPFFVMELVKGTPITNFCDERRLSPRERLELFVTVCQAIQHAHQKGVIHRDIKPSNVLVALYDDQPVPKVIDFGVAKAAGQPLTARTLHTGYGAIVGTPEYMSPEQATFNQLDIDTRSDVYSLGVLLYELLTGATPLDKARFKEAAVLEMLRVVREEEPPRPSVKLSTTAARAGIAATRGTDSDKLAQLLRGELDWIVMKALEKERQRRYETAAGLARDVGRYLNDELVEARPPSAGYRLRKFARRHRGPVLAATLVLLALLGGVIGTTVGMLRAYDAERRATVAFKAADVSRTIAESLRDQAIKALAEAKTQTLGADTARHALVMEQAMRSWEDGDVGEATRFLGLVAPPFQQSWETRFLRERCRLKFRPFPMPADETLAWVSPSSDGRWLVERTLFTGEPETLHVLNPRSGETRFKFVAPCQSWAFSSDGAWLIVAGNVTANDRLAGYATIFDLKTGQRRLTFDEIAGGLFDVDISPDDQRIALGCRDEVRICNAKTGKLLQALAQSGETNHLAFCPDGRSVAACSILSGKAEMTSLVRVWNLGLGTAEFSRELKVVPDAGSPLSAVALSPAGKHLVLTFQNEVVELWDAKTGATQWTLDKIKGQYIGAAFSADSKHIVCTGGDKVFVLDPQTGQIEKSFKASGANGFGRGTPLYASGTGYLPDGEHVVVGTGVWNLNDVALESVVCKDPTADPFRENGSMCIATFSGDGKRIFACASTLSSEIGQAEELLSWDARTGRQNMPVVRHKARWVDVHAFSRDGQRVLLASHDGLLRVCDTETGNELVSIHGPPGQAYPFADINADGTWIASADGKRIIIWDVATGAKKQFCGEHPGGVGFIAVSSDGKQIAAADNPFATNAHTRKESLVLIWDVETGRQLRSCSVANKENVACLAFSPDGRRLVAGYEGSGALAMWDMRTGRVLHMLKGHTTSVVSAAFSPDGTRLATGGFDETVRLWDVETGQEVLAIKIPGGRGQSVAFSADGKRLAACLGYKAVTVWEAP